MRAPPRVHAAAAALDAVPGAYRAQPRRLLSVWADVPLAADLPGGRVAVEVLGTRQLTVGVRGPAGAARARRALLEALGYAVVAVDGPKWMALPDDAARTKALRALLEPYMHGGGG